MTASPGRRATGFYLGFLLVTLLIAGGLSYFASSAPDGLESVTQTGCQVSAAEDLEGSCIAQHAQPHALEAGPLADYTVRGGEATVGLAGVLGVVVTLAAAGGLFWLLRRPSPQAPTAPGSRRAAGPGRSDS